MKNEEARDQWDRARKALSGAKALLGVDPDGSASRAYYAAFHAVSALFLLEGRAFRKHSALEAAVHRDLVRSGRWTNRLGGIFSKLREWREIGDYGMEAHMEAEDAEEAISLAETILNAVAEDFSGDK